MLIFLSPVILLFDNAILLLALRQLWFSFWYYCAIVDYYVIVNIYNTICYSCRLCREGFLSIIWFIEKNVTVEFFIYFIFLPIAFIPCLLLTLINHAGRYTLPYSKCGRPKRTKQSGRRGLHLSRYFASLRNKDTIIRPATFKEGRSRRYHPKRITTNKSTGVDPSSDPTVDPSKQQYCLSASEQVNELIAANPEIELDLFLFEAKLYWNSMPSPSLLTTKEIDSFLHSFDILQHFRNISAHLPSLASRYKSISSTTAEFQRILLEAKGLQTSIQQYGEILPLSSPAIYVSSNKDDLPIVIDTGASCTITPCLSDFTATPTTPDIDLLGSLTTVTTKVTGQGPIEWDIEDVNGVITKLPTTSYYVPEATIRLFSPQGYFADNPTASLTLNIDGIALHMPCGTVLRFPIQPGSNLPIMLTKQSLHRGRTKSQSNKPRHKPSFHHMSNTLSFLCSSTYDYFVHGMIFHLQHSGTMAAVICDDAVLKHANNNLSPEQKELLLWHYRLGHIGIARVQSLLQKPRTSSFNDMLNRIISPSNNKSSHCHPPLCTSCQYAKQKRKNPPKHTVATPLTSTGLSDDILGAGDRVSVDLYCSSTTGRLPHTFGREKTSLQFTGGAIFVDHATRLIHNTHQHSTTTAETVLSKHLFENYCDSFGVRIKEYVTDNNPFHGGDWTNDCKNQRQSHKFSGVGAHHQNYAERNIQSIFNMARAMLIHFAMHWPQASSTDLWPFAVDQAVYIWNHLPDSDTKLSSYNRTPG